MKGDGEVFQEKGKWAVRWYAAGSRRRRYLGGFPCEEEARAAIALILAQQRLQLILAAAAESAPPLAGSGEWTWAAERWRSMSPRERQAVIFARDRGRCSYCKRAVRIWPSRPRPGQDMTDRAEMDHRQPLSAGGPDTMANVCLACHACNHARADTGSATVRAG